MTVQIAIKCCVPEQIDCVTHAAITFDIDLLESLAKRLVLANRIKEEADDGTTEFQALRFREFSPDFLDACPKTLGVSEEEFQGMEGGFIFLPESMHDQLRDCDASCGMREIALIVHAGLPTGKTRERIWWEARVKHDESGAVIQTYSLYLTDLRKIAEKLGHWLCDCGVRLGKGYAICPECCKKVRENQ